MVMDTPPLTVPHQALEEICREHRISRLEIFGSVLREDYGPNSDIDILVEFEPDTPVGFVPLSRIQRQLSDLLQHPVDLVPRDGLKPAIRDDVLSQAQVIYAT